MYWMSNARESVLLGDTLLALGESPYNTELAQWAKNDGGIYVAASTASNLFLELLNEPLQRATQLAVAPKWMALAWKRKNRHGSMGVLSGAEVAVGWAFRAESVALEEQISNWLTSKKSSRRYRHWFQTHYAQGSLRPANYSISTVDPWAKKWADATGLYDAPLVLAVAKSVQATGGVSGRSCWFDAAHAPYGQKVRAQRDRFVPSGGQFARGNQLPALFRQLLGEPTSSCSRPSLFCFGLLQHRSCAGAPGTQTRAQQGFGPHPMARTRGKYFAESGETLCA
jgi:hypothetical protein